MTKRDPAKNNTAAKADTPAQLWRDRLNKTKQAKQQLSQKATAGTTKGTSFQKTTPGSSNRKTRKGLRPG